MSMSNPPGGGSQRIVLPGVKQTIAVASGKGGVGKSTVAANLALALRMQEHQVGLMDADIYGPSVPIMMGLGMIDQKTSQFSIDKYGLKLMSMGFIVAPDQAMIWRGPMVHKAITQLLKDINWGQLDYLVIDLPPGTGDAQLTLTAPLSGAVVVTTPQDVSLIDARKGLKMFQQVLVPVLGIVENMSYFIFHRCGERHEIFRHGGGERCAKELSVPFLGAIPLDPAVALQGDAGEPIVHSHPDSPIAQAYLTLASAVKAQVEAMQSELAELPTLEIQ